MQTDQKPKMLHRQEKGAATAEDGLLVIRDGIYACDDCVQAIANDDYTGLRTTGTAGLRGSATRGWHRYKWGFGRLAKDGVEAMEVTRVQS